MPWRWSILPDLLYSLCPPTDQLFLFVAGWGQGLKWMNLTPRRKMSSARTMLSAVAKDRVVTQFPQVRLLAQEYLLFTMNRSYPKPKVNQPWVSFSVLNTAVFVGMYACMYLCEYLYTYTHVPLCMWLCLCLLWMNPAAVLLNSNAHFHSLSLTTWMPAPTRTSSSTPRSKLPAPRTAQEGLGEWSTIPLTHFPVLLCSFYCANFFCGALSVEKEGGGVKWR